MFARLRAKQGNAFGRVVLGEAMRDRAPLRVTDRDRIATSEFAFAGRDPRREQARSPAQRLGRSGIDDERTALLVPPDAPEPMAKAVVRLIEDDALRQRLVAAGLADVARYQWAAVSTQWLAVYRRALGQAPVPAAGTQELRS